MTTCVLLSTVVLLIVPLSFFVLRPPAAQEGQGAVLVLTSPSVTLTSYYQIQLVPGPALLLKQRVPLSPHTLHPHPATPFSLLLASPASKQPCSRSTCVHHGDKAGRGMERQRERERERERVSPSIICVGCALSLSPTLSPDVAGAAQTLARWEPQ